MNYLAKRYIVNHVGRVRNETLLN